MKKKHYPNRWDIRCDYCGRFIAGKDFDDGKVGRDFIPDSYYDSEHTSFWHNLCKKIYDSEQRVREETYSKLNGTP